MKLTNVYNQKNDSKMATFVSSFNQYISKTKTEQHNLTYLDRVVTHPV